MMITPFFEIGVVNSKTPANIGMLWRSAYQLGAEGIFTIGKRYHRQPTDVSNASRKIRYRNYDNLDALIDDESTNIPLIAVEMGGEDLITFEHPDRAIYILGAEDFGVPEDVLRLCSKVISIPSIRLASYNVAVAGALVMYDRIAKRNEFNKQS